MALTVRPADGLIHRLLQQNSQATSKPYAEKLASIHVNDQINISQGAREQATAGNNVVDSRQQTQSRLESQLLRLYTHHTYTEDKK